MEQQQKERAVLNKETLEHRQKVAEVTRKLQEIDTAKSGETKKRLKAELEELKKQEEDYKKKEETLAKKERVSFSILVVSPGCIKHMDIVHTVYSYTLYIVLMWPQAPAQAMPFCMGGEMVFYEENYCD